MFDETTSRRVGSLAGRGLENLASLTADEIRSVLASALTQCKPEHRPSRNLFAPPAAPSYSALAALAAEVEQGRGLLGPRPRTEGLLAAALEEWTPKGL